MILSDKIYKLLIEYGYITDKILPRVEIVVDGDEVKIRTEFE